MFKQLMQNNIGGLPSEDVAHESASAVAVEKAVARHAAARPTFHATGLACAV